MVNIDYNSYRSVKSFNHRTRFLIMHYTAVDFYESIISLTGPDVSAHYLIPDPTDESYIKAGFSGMRIFNLVDENERAWHAGISYWAGRSNLNDSSIGIELVNLATDNDGVMSFPPFNLEQISALKQLALNILQRYPDISPSNIIGHSDISPGRKNDPGASFPWKELYNYGIGAWYDEDVKNDYCRKFSHNTPSQQEIISMLNRYGYDTVGTETEIGYQQLLRTFQLHFRPCNYSGLLDIETAAILYALVEKYKP